MMQPRISSFPMVEDHLLQINSSILPKRCLTTINMVMKDGKKSVAEKIVESLTPWVKRRKKTDPSLPAETAWKLYRLGYPTCCWCSHLFVWEEPPQVPMPISTDRQPSLALKWIVSMLESSERSMAERLAAELFHPKVKGIDQEEG